VHRWAREHGYNLTTRSEFDGRHPDRPKTGLYVRFERDRRVERQLALGNAELASLDQ
jgi:hypothetical protein